VVSEQGTAVAIAMSGSALPSDKRFAITTNWGNFRGTNAMSFIAQARIRRGQRCICRRIPVWWDWYSGRSDLPVVAPTISAVIPGRGLQPANPEFITSAPPYRGSAGMKN
jgi:hypothetical protein